MNGIKITKEHFKKLSVEEQNLIIFESLECLNRKLSLKLKFDTFITAIMGFCGGLASKYIGK